MRRPATVSLGERAAPVWPAGRRRRAGVVLLEVVLALTLFSGTALIILGGLNASLRTAQRVQTDAAATDLAVTLLSEVQMGFVPLVDDGPNDYEDEALVDWTWEIVTESFEEDSQELVLPEFLHVTVIVRHRPSGYTYRLTQLMSEESYAPELAGEDADLDAEGGFE